MERNFPSLRELCELPEDQRANISIETLQLCQRDIEERDAELEADKGFLQRLIHENYGDIATAKYRQKNQDTGTVTFKVDPEHTIECKVSKRVTWDDGKLKEMCETILHHGDDPGKYVEIVTVRKISEKAWGEFAPQIQAFFLPARTVKAGEPAYTIKLKEKDQ